MDIVELKLGQHTGIVLRKSPGAAKGYEAMRRRGTRWPKARRELGVGGDSAEPGKPPPFSSRVGIHYCVRSKGTRIHTIAMTVYGAITLRRIPIISVKGTYLSNAQEESCRADSSAYA